MSDENSNFVEMIKIDSLSNYNLGHGLMQYLRIVYRNNSPELITPNESSDET